MKQQLATGQPMVDALTPNDWQELIDLRDLLQHLKMVTKALEGNAKTGSHGALWEWLPGVDFLLNHLEKKKQEQEHTGESHFKACVELGWEKLDQYYNLSDESPAYVVPIALHPSKKLRWFQKHWSEKQSWIAAAEAQLRKLFDQEKSRQQPLTTPATTVKVKEVSALDLYNDVDDDDDAIGYNDELAQYLAEPPVPVLRDHFNNVLPSNPIYWWRDNKGRFPILHQLAMNHFACPAMSSECERCFSIGGQVLNEHRPQTLEDYAEAQQCMKAWISHGLVDLLTILQRVRETRQSSNQTSQSSNQATAIEQSINQA